MKRNKERTTNGFDEIDFPIDIDGADDSEDENKDEELDSFYDAIEDLAVDGAMYFRKIKELLTEEEYAKENADKLKKTLEKITRICDAIDDFANDNGRY